MLVDIATAPATEKHISHVLQFFCFLLINVLLGLHFGFLLHLEHLPLLADLLHLDGPLLAPVLAVLAPLHRPLLQHLVLLRRAHLQPVDALLQLPPHLLLVLQDALLLLLLLLVITLAAQVSSLGQIKYIVLIVVGVILEIDA